jgi:hypothetical protein
MGRGHFRYGACIAVSCRASNEQQLEKEVTMRTAYALGLAAFLAATPAMAQVVIGGGDASRHEAQAQQDRGAAQQDSAAARQRAAVGDYRGAARDQQEAQQERHAANHQERKADRDDNGTVIRLGH